MRRWKGPAAHERRLAKLEAATDPSRTGLAHLTDDEIAVHLLDASRLIAADETATLEERAAAAGRVVTVEVGVRAQAALRRSPGYDAHLAHVARGRSDYVPAIFADMDGRANGMLEYSDLHRPNIMQRRAAILARPDIRAIVGSIADA